MHKKKTGSVLLCIMSISTLYRRKHLCKISFFLNHYLQFSNSSFCNKWFVNIMKPLTSYGFLSTIIDIRKFILNFHIVLSYLSVFIILIEFKNDMISYCFRYCRKNFDVVKVFSTAGCCTSKIFLS